MCHPRCVLCSCNACIYFNKQCLARKLTPTHARIKVPNTSPAHLHTKHKASVMRIKDEVRYLHSKKKNLNTHIYDLHLQLADSWSGFWPHTQHAIEDKLQKEFNLRYKNMDNKLARLAQQQTQDKPPKHSFYLRVVNMTDIPFSEPEMSILQKGPKYNLHSKPENWLQTLALEAETAITHLPPSHREVYRMLTAERISTLQENNRPPHAHIILRESNIIQNIKMKLNDNNAMITWADKGNSLVILPTEHYKNKVEQFIQSNNFLTSKTNPTESFQTQVRRVINNSKALIPPDKNENTSTSTHPHLLSKV